MRRSRHSRWSCSPSRAAADEDEGGAQASKPVLKVSAAASLTEAFEALKQDYTAADLRFSFAGSDELAAQIRKGVKPDVFAAANTKLPDALAKENLVEKPVVFATNELVLAVPAEGAKVTSLDDLQKPGIKIAVGSESVPVGEYTRKVLSGLPAAQQKAIEANFRSEEPDVKGVVGKISQSAVDAGFVYQSDVDAASGKLKAIALPDELKPTVAYGAAVVKGAKQPAAAKAFIQSLINGPGQDRSDRRRPGPPAALMRRGAWFPALLTAALASVLVFLGLPVAAIFLDTSPGELIASLGEPEAQDALLLSLKTTSASLALIMLVGTPAAYLLATRELPRQGGGGDAGRAPPGAPARGGRHRPVGLGRPGRPAGLDHRRQPRAADGGRGGGADLRGLAVLHPPGAVGLRRP